MSPYHFLRYWCYCIVCLNRIIPQVKREIKMQHQGAVKLFKALTRTHARSKLSSTNIFIYSEHAHAVENSGLTLHMQMLVSET